MCVIVAPICKPFVSAGTTMVDIAAGSRIKLLLGDDLLDFWGLKEDGIRGIYFEPQYPINTYCRERDDKLSETDREFAYLGTCLYTTRLGSRLADRNM